MRLSAFKHECGLKQVVTDGISEFLGGDASPVILIT